jgi:transcriptional regulator NrdR family protein
MALLTLDNMQHIVKRAGHQEPFDPRKTYASVYSACMNLRMPAQEAELIADHVTKAVQDWLNSRASVTSHQLAEIIHRQLHMCQPHAAYMYRTHDDLC